MVRRVADAEAAYDEMKSERDWWRRGVWTLAALAVANAVLAWI